MIMADQAQRLREIMERHKKAAAPARVIAITSGKGGVGKTCISVNLGIALSKLGKRVLLVDVDLGLANVDVMMGIVPRFNMGDVIFNGKELSDVLEEGPHGLKIFAGASGLQQLADLNDVNLDHCLKNLIEIENYADIILIDTGAGISKNVLKFVLAAGEVIIVTTPDPTAITDAYGIIKVLVGYDAQLPLRVIVNMVQTAKEGAQVIQRLSTVSQKFLGISLAELGYLPADPVVAKAVKEQTPFVINHPHASVTRSLNQIADRLLAGDGAEEPKPVAAPVSFFERFVKQLRRV